MFEIIPETQTLVATIATGFGLVAMTVALGEVIYEIFKTALRGIDD